MGALGFQSHRHTPEAPQLAVSQMLKFSPIGIRGFGKKCSSYQVYIQSCHSLVFITGVLEFFFLLLNPKKPQTPSDDFQPAHMAPWVFASSFFLSPVRLILGYPAVSIFER